jgi:nitrite reductase/ring-hydroxylating ferredoxin subunit
MQAAADQPGTKWMRVFASPAAATERVAVGEVLSISFKAYGLRVALARTAQGFYAMVDRCPHLDVPLSRGLANGVEEIVCYWHGYRWSLRTGEERTNNQCPDLVRYPVRLDADGLYICIPVKPPLAEPTDA